MKIQENLLSGETQKNFLEGVSKPSKIFQRAKLSKIFQRQKNFLESFAESAVKNFKMGVDSVGKILWKEEESQQEFTEGGIRIQENRPKSGGREETQTK